jgi:hypothetical protein
MRHILCGEDVLRLSQKYDLVLLRLSATEVHITGLHVAAGLAPAEVLVGDKLPPYDGNKVDLWNNLFSTAPSLTSRRTRKYANHSLVGRVLSEVFSLWRGRERKTRH